MKTALDLIMHFEGFRPNPYQCPAGKWTVGYGFTTYKLRAVTKDYPAQITEQEALEELNFQLHTLITRFEVGLYGVRKKWGELTTQQKWATLDLAYNVGFTAVINSKFFKNSDPDELDDWNKATVNGKRVVLPGLTARRQAEKKLWLEGVA